MLFYDIKSIVEILLKYFILFFLCVVEVNSVIDVWIKFKVNIVKKKKVKVNNLYFRKYLFSLYIRYYLRLICGKYKYKMINKNRYII